MRERGRFYEAADLFLCASEHEGFCVPIVEAFYKQVPVLAYAATAVPSSAASPADRPAGPHSTAELIEFQQGRTADAPLCLTCGTKMRPAGSCYVCEGCGSTSGCS